MDITWARAGILIEIIGAGYIVYGAWQGRLALVPYQSMTYNNLGPALQEIVRILRAQFYDQARGFAILVIGLTMQFVGS